MNITYDYYRTFYYAAKYGSFSKAAAVLMKGQPNITKIINNLEDQLGCKLFVRTNKGTTLTAAGERLYRHAEIAFENLNKAEQEIAAENSLNGGQISIATTEIGLYGCLLSALTRFSQDLPGIKIRLSSFNSPQALQSVKNGLSDFAVVTLDDRPDDFFQTIKIRDFYEYLCCNKGYSYDRKNIFKSPYISISRNSNTYKFHQEYLLSLGISKEPGIEVSTADQVMPLVKSGIGIGFISEFLAADELEKGSIEEIKLPQPQKTRSIYIVQDKTKILSAAADSLKKYICV